MLCRITQQSHVQDLGRASRSCIPIVPGCSWCASPQGPHMAKAPAAIPPPGPAAALLCFALPCLLPPGSPTFCCCRFSCYLSRRQDFKPGWFPAAQSRWRAGWEQQG